MERITQYIVYSIIVIVQAIGDAVLDTGKALGHTSIIVFQKIRPLLQAFRKWLQVVSKRTGRKLYLFFVRVRNKTAQVLKKTGTTRKHVSRSLKRNKRRQKAKIVVVYPLPLRFRFRYFIWGFLVSLVFIFLPLLVFLFVQDLPNPKELSLRQIPQTTKIFDRNGALLYQMYASQNRTLIHLSDIPETMQHATIAIEDKNFYTHPGFDIGAMLRAFHQDTSGGNFQGGSTITQQLIKSAILTPEPSLMRKIKEVILAFWAERMYNKKQILEMYFNQVPYGGTAWGIEAAAEVYFGKGVKDLDLAQSAFLAGLTSAPTIYSPYGQNPNLWKKRQSEVLKRMVALNYITQHQADDAKKESLQFNPQQTPLNAPHFVYYVRDLLVKKYGLPMVEKGGLNVKTSLDLHVQNQVQGIVADEINKAAYLNLSNGAALVTNPQNGDIIAMVGSRDYDASDFGKVNVTTALRQPGSSIKVVTYAAALTRGFTAATILDDTPITYNTEGAPAYSPVNYDGRFHGRVPLRLALANSFNIPAVKTLNQIGIPAMVQTGKSMGITSWDDPKDYGLSITLGAADVTMLDMAQVYGTLANAGKHVDLNPILEITDYKGDEIEKKTTVPARQVLSPNVTFILSDILADNNARAIEFGTNSPLQIPGKYVSVKTGTTDSKRDNWTIGYTPQIVVTTWVGNNDNSPMSQDLASGITGAAPIWNRIMSYLLANKPDVHPSMPPDIIQKSCFGHNEFFIKGTENSVNCGETFSPSPQQNH